MPVARYSPERSTGRAVRIQAARTSADSQYQQIVALVHAAEESHAPVVRLADRFAIPFTAVALVIAGTAWALSGDSTRFAEVLVLATPSPLLIAAPVAFLGGLSRAAKTGTLTQGRPNLVDVRPAAGVDADELLMLAASRSEAQRPVARET